MPDRGAGPDLRTRVDEHSLTVGLPTAEIVFRRDGHAGTARLRFGRLGVGADVSMHPAAVVAVVDDQARLAGVDPNRWRTITGRELRSWSVDCSSSDREPVRLLGDVGAFTHPLLAELYRQGVRAIDEIPRWASPFLRCRTIADAARLLAPTDATRRLTRAIAGSLSGAHGGVDLDPLAFAVAARELVSSDVIANVLDAAARQAPAASRPADVEQLRAIRRGLEFYPTARRSALLLDAARHQSPARFADLLAQLCWVADHVARPLPQRVDELAELCTSSVPVIPSVPSPQPQGQPQPQPNVATRTTPPDPTTACIDMLAELGMLDEQPGPAEPLAARRTDAAPERRPVPRRRRPPTAVLPAPASPTTAPGRWPVPRALLPISERRWNGVTFRVPTSAAELTLWSRQLDNCLDTFVAAAAHERSWLIGLHRNDRLIGCVEVNPRSRRIRQATGPRNQALPPDVYDTALWVLSDAGVVRADPGP